MSTVGKYFDTALIRGIDEGVGATGVVQSLHATPADGSLELMTGIPGTAGLPGEPGRAFRWEGDIADQSALSALSAGLGPGQAGKAWRVLSANTLVYWNGSSFDTFTDAFGAAGPDGGPCTVRLGNVETGPVGSELQATITGVPPDLILDLTVPRGVKGRKGEPGGPGPIREAPDYLDLPLVEGAVPVWDQTVNKWTSRPYPGLRGPWSIMEGRAWDGGAGFSASQANIGTSPNTVARLTIPAQDTDWSPIVAGGVLVQTTEGATTYVTRIDAEVRIGSDSGQIVAQGSGLPAGIDGHCDLMPYFGTRCTPTDSVGVIPAGQAAVLVVVLRRNAGSSNYNYYLPGAQISCWARPVDLPNAPALDPALIITAGTEEPQ
ncbi:hypothetical protein [Nocardia sp. NPDC058480]|uniref:hypothetical protein n=1 Tax=unclassified Nocardia TaxID=2637762 RepID=UPI00365EB0D2